MRASTSACGTASSTASVLVENGPSSRSTLRRKSGPTRSAASVNTASRTMSSTTTGLPAKIPSAPMKPAARCHNRGSQCSSSWNAGSLSSPPQPPSSTMRGRRTARWSRGRRQRHLVHDERLQAHRREAGLGHRRHRRQLAGQHVPHRPLGRVVEVLLEGDHADVGQEAEDAAVGLAARSRGVPAHERWRQGIDGSSTGVVRLTAVGVCANSSRSSRTMKARQAQFGSRASIVPAGQPCVGTTGARIRSRVR